MSANLHPFRPTLVGTVNVSATTSSQAVALATSPVFRKDVVITNTGTTTAFVEFGGSAVTAAAASGLPVLGPGQIRVHAGDATHAAVIMASSTATVYFSAGVGD